MSSDRKEFSLYGSFRRIQSFIQQIGIEQLGAVLVPEENREQRKQSLPSSSLHSCKKKEKVKNKYDR